MKFFQNTRFSLAECVRHNGHDFLGMVVDVDYAFCGPPDEIGDVAPDQPFYSVLAIGRAGGFMAYAAESVLERAPDSAIGCLMASEKRVWFTIDDQGHHAPADKRLH